MNISSNVNVIKLFNHIKNNNKNDIFDFIKHFGLCRKEKLNIIFEYFNNKLDIMLQAEIAGVPLESLSDKKKNIDYIYKFTLADLILKKLTNEKLEEINESVSVKMNNINDVMENFTNITQKPKSLSDNDKRSSNVENNVSDHNDKGDNDNGGEDKRWNVENNDNEGNRRLNVGNNVSNLEIDNNNGNNNNGASKKNKKRKKLFHHITKRHLYFVGNKRINSVDNKKLRRRSHYENLIKKIELMMKQSPYNKSESSTNTSRRDPLPKDYYDL